MPDHAWVLFTTAAVLGLRHGFDWDHLAAISDIVGTADTGGPSGVAQIAAPAKRSLLLASMYALGHATVVAILGLLALNLSFVLPVWIDAVIERIVGATLLLLSVWLCNSLINHFKGKKHFHLKSRWMALFSLFKIGARAQSTRPYGSWTAFNIGMLHGVGAETGTQVVLIAAIGGAASHGLALAMLFSFISGLLASNFAVAVCSITSFKSAQKAQPMYLTAGVLTCLFSFVVGSYFVLGKAEALPDLQTCFSNF